MQERHDELAEEMLYRGYKHESPYVLPNLEYLKEQQVNPQHDIAHNINDLIHRCNDCAARIYQFLNSDEPISA
jgi:hypothetical protein